MFLELDISLAKFNNLLVYKKPNKIYLPTVITDSEEKFIADIHHKLNISFLDENVEKNLERYKEHFDVILTDESDFNDVKNILK